MVLPMLKVCRRLALIAAALLGAGGIVHAQSTAETNQIKAELLLEQSAVARSEEHTSELQSH